MFEEAKWIIHIKEHEYDLPSPLMRKSFLLKDGIKNAVLYVCGLGLGVYYVNGTEVTDDVLTTPISNYDIKTYYNSYDVTSLLGSGENVIGAMLGNGWYNNPCGTWTFDFATWRDYPKLIAQLDIEYESGERESIVTNSSWKATEGPILYNNTRIGETYDARLEINGWNKPGFYDDSWDNAKVWFGSGGELAENRAEPVKRIRTVVPTKISEGTYSVGINTTGWVKIHARGKRGSRVRITYAERITPENKIDNEPERLFIKDVDKNPGDEYILKGEGVEVWEPRFVYHGFAYFEISGDFDEVDPVVVVVHSALEKTGEFSCSNDMLNKIHKASLNSTCSNIVSIPTDCPHREQMGWTGDVAISAEQTLRNFAVENIYKRWMSDMKDVQRKNGQLPVTVPLTPWRWRWFGGPTWDAAFFVVPYQIYKITNDKELIERNFDAMVHYLDFAYTMSEDYIIDFFFGDHCPPENCKACGVDLIATAYYYSIVKIVSECARLIGRAGEQYDELADNIRDAFRRHFVKGGRVKYDCQASYACAIYHGLLDDEEIPQAMERLTELIKEKQEHFDTGILGTKALFTVLSENGQAELLYRMVTNPTMPSYAYWINNNMTALCEMWDMSASRNHHMYSEVDNWFYKYLAGIRIDGEKIIIKPVFLKEIEWARASCRGISVCYNKREISIYVPRAATLVLNEKSIPLKAGCNTFGR